MDQVLTLELGPPHVCIPEGIVGSELRFALYVRQKTAPDTYVPFDFTGYSFGGDIKKNVRNAAVLVSYGITAPGAAGAGYVDVVLGGAATLDQGPGDYESSVVMWPTGNIDAKKTLAVVSFTLVYAATR